MVFLDFQGSSEGRAGPVWSPILGNDLAAFFSRLQYRSNQLSKFQHTIRHPISCTGIGLHSGARVSLTLHPAEQNSGIIFLRSDIGGNAGRIAARYQNVVDTNFCTTLANAEGTRIGTVEHLMAALLGCGIDNVLIEVDGPEVPVMDGSAAPFVFLLECAGLEEQSAPRRYIRVLKRIEAGTDDCRATLLPSENLSFSFEISYDNPVISTQVCEFEPHSGSFKDDICQARTYGFAHEVEALRAKGLAQGGSLENAIVVTEDSILNPEGLRFADEFVRHKVLDAMGDLYLAGGPIRARFEGVRSGHRINHDLICALFADQSAWRFDTIDDPVAETEPYWASAPAVATA